ncbi:S8 family peptidase [Flavihumibacter sp. ZG627]|uniref:S8 family peptidase n=1 Tax=Flavihumibacter sp. ZG627 TaxID=1463156 RepID=UPI00155A07B4|nr:S8 family peptidase [Flavihumibacter sp. ZG627]
MALKFSSRAYPLMFLLVFNCFPTLAQKKKPDTTLLAPYLKIAEGSKNTQLTDSDTEYFAVVSSQLPGEVTVLRQLAHDIFIISISSQAKYAQLKENARLVFPVNDNWKMSPPLLERFLQNSKENYNNRLLLRVSDTAAFRDRYLQPVSNGIKLIKIFGNAIVLVAPFRWIREQALSDANITFISIADHPHAERELTGFDLSANRVNTLHRYRPDLNGNGFIASIKENLMDTADLDLVNRFVASEGTATTPSTHATNMTTIVAGAGNSFYTGKGVAWAAGYSSSDFVNLLPDNNNSIQQTGITVQNHSYGTGIENYYGADAAAYDQQSVSIPWLQHVFSAGNSGNSSSSTGIYAGIAGYANLTGSFKMSKNSISIGAMDSSGNVLMQSSKGPAHDGRIKPELVAFGEDGSSGAAAIVSGLSILLQQEYAKRKGELPPSSLTRSILFNSADDVGAPGIDYRSGFGSVNALKAISILEDEKYFLGTVAKNGVSAHTITVPANAMNLKLTLSWTDPAAAENTSHALVNDLDLELINIASGQLWQSWVLSTAPKIDSLERAAIRGRDSVNNSEQVSLPLPPAGSYQIRISGHSLLTSSQDYALSWNHDTTGSFLFTYPVRGDNLTSGARNRIRWESSIQGSGQLEYSFDGGEQWIRIGDNIPINTGEFFFEAPALYRSILLRMTAGVEAYYSDTVGLSRELHINTGFNCADSFMIHWQKAPDIQQYQLFRLEGRYMQPFRVVNDSFLVLPKINNPAEYYTIAPILPYGIVGRRAYTLNYKNQLLECYLRSFLAIASEPGEAIISFSLGSVYGVRQILVQRFDGNDFITIFDPGTNFLSDNRFFVPASDGVNLYRGVIITDDGQQFYTNTETVYQFSEKPLFLFPNPVRRGQPLRILTDIIDELELTLYDVQGRICKQIRLTERIQDINTAGLSAGIYFYHIHGGNIMQRTGKIVIQ